MQDENSKTKEDGRKNRFKASGIEGANFTNSANAHRLEDNFSQQAERDNW